MNYMEIILEDIKKKYLDEIIREVRKPDNEDVISSHFFDEKSDKDIAFQDIGNFSDFFEIAGTGNLFLKEAQFEKNNNLKKLFSKLWEIQQKYLISTILVGYEPATDDDMKIAVFRCGQVTLYNEKSFSSQFARASYDTLRCCGEDAGQK